MQTFKVGPLTGRGRRKRRFQGKARAILQPFEIQNFAHNHPFYDGAVVKNGLHGAFNGAHREHLALLTVGQIEHIVYLFAEVPPDKLDTNQSVAMGEYIFALSSMRQANWAYEYEWVPRGIFPLVPDRAAAKVVDDIPEGPPEHLRSTSLRTLLGERYPEADYPFLDNPAQEGDLLKIALFAGERVNYTPYMPVNFSNAARQVNGQQQSENKKPLPVAKKPEPTPAAKPKHAAQRQMG